MPCSLLTHRHTHRLSLSHRHTHTLARAPVSHWTLSTCDVCIMHWWRVGLLTTTCSTDYMWRNHQRSDLSCLGGRRQRGWERGGVGDSAKVFTRRLASGWTIAGQVSGVSSSHGQLKQVMIREHFKKRENARILNKKRQHFQKSDKCCKATNAKIARQTTTIKRQKCPFVGIRQKRKTLF